MQAISKSQFKARALAYFREVQRTGVPLIISEYGQPVLKVVPYVEDLDEALRPLRGTVLRYDRPEDPVGGDDWEASR